MMEMKIFTKNTHVNQGLIQFHFGIKGKAKFVFNEGIMP
jgi:hypothetical protein